MNPLNNLAAMNVVNYVVMRYMKDIIDDKELTFVSNV